MSTLSLLRRLPGSLLLALSLTFASLWVLNTNSFVTHAANLAVNSLADSIVDDGQCTLREAIIAANTDTASGAALNECIAGFGNDVIDLTNLRGTISVSSTLPTITSNIVFNGPGATNLTIDGGGAVRVFNITGGTVTISGLTIANGFVDGTNGSHGGGIFINSPDTVTVMSSTLANNQARGADGEPYWPTGASGCCFGGGGGIFYSGPGRLNIFQATFSDNSAIGGNGGTGGYGNGGGGGGGAFGGGFFNDGGIVTIMTSTFIANRAIGGNGGSYDGCGSGPFDGAGGGGEVNGLGGGGRGGAYGSNGRNGNFAGGGGGGSNKNPSTLGGKGGFAGGDGGGSNNSCPRGGGGGGGLGGGLFNNSGVINVLDTAFINNQVAGGLGQNGGQAGRGVSRDIFNWATLALTNTTLTNTAPVLISYIPANGAPDLPLNLTLGWNVNDPEGDYLRFDVAFGTNPGQLTQTTGVTSPFTPPLPLNPLTTYYWVVTATDGLSTTSSGILSFTTATPPTLNFEAVPQTGTVPLTVAFNNLSNNATWYYWTFGDGQGIGAISPTHVYSKPGAYTVTLTAGNVAAAVTITRSNFITVYEYETPITALSATNDGFTGLGQATTLIATITSGSNVIYRWDMGDGTTANGAVVSHTYTSVGTYTAVVTASNPVSVVSATTTVIVKYPLTIIANSPNGNDRIVDENTTVSAAFSRAIDTATVTSRTFAIWGKFTGHYPGSYTINENGVTFENPIGYKPGEEIVINLSRGIEAPDDVPLTPYQWQLRAPVSNSSGTFIDSGQRLGNSPAEGVALGDVDSDGDLDSLIANSSYHLNTLWLNDGLGEFTLSQSFGGDPGKDVELGDFNHDGDLDAFILNDAQPSQVWLNNGSGTFTDSGQRLGLNYTQELALGDVNGDGNLDVLAVNSGGQASQIWLNDGLARFIAGYGMVNSDAFGADLGDVDNDGDLDAVFANNSNYGSTVWLNRGNGTFTLAQNLGTYYSWDVALGDLDGDGDLDAYFADGCCVDYKSDVVWLNDGTGHFSDSGQRLGRLFTNAAVALGDVDGDGDLDAWVTNRGNDPSSLWLNNGLGQFSDSGQELGRLSLYEFSQGFDLALGDLDGDGDLDAYVAEGIGSSIFADHVWFNQSAPAGQLSAISDSPTLLGSLSHLTATTTAGGGLTYTWDFGDGTTGTGRFVSHLYPSVGTYSALVVASNSLGSLTATTPITITDLPPLAIPITGGTVTPTAGVTFTASSNVFSDTILITYTVQPVTSTGTLGHVGLFYDLRATYLSTGLPAQPQLGQRYTITVTYPPEDVPNGLIEDQLALYYWDGTGWVKEPTSTVNETAYSITATPNHFSLWAALAPLHKEPEQLPISLTSVSLVGPTTGVTNTIYTCTTTYQPVTATLPVTYTFFADEQNIWVNQAGVVTFSWKLIGTKTITVEAKNVSGVMVSDTHSIGIEISSPQELVGKKVYLPIVLKY